MYNTKIICTYNTSEVFLETDTITEKEKDFIRNVIYRQELLDIFNINEYQDTELSNAIHQLFLQIETCKELEECILEVLKIFLIKDYEVGLFILYSYDYMYLMHDCVCEYLETNTIRADTIIKLKNALQIDSLCHLHHIS